MVSVIKPLRQSYSEFDSHVVAPFPKFPFLYEAPPEGYGIDWNTSFSAFYSLLTPLMTLGVKSVWISEVMHVFISYNHHPPPPGCTWLLVRTFLQTRRAYAIVLCSTSDITVRRAQGGALTAHCCNIPCTIRECSLLLLYGFTCRQTGVTFLSSVTSWKFVVTFAFLLHVIKRNVFLRPPHVWF